jgi:predicted metal-dependent HD superfamily phosphohydrolase
LDRHELFDELDAADPRWQKNYRSIPHAAAGLNLLKSYRDFANTPAGVEYRRKIASAHDHVGDNARRANQIAAERRMAAAASRDRSAVNIESTVREESFFDGE